MFLPSDSLIKPRYVSDEATESSIVSLDVGFCMMGCAHCATVQVGIEYDPCLDNTRVFHNTLNIQNIHTDILSLFFLGVYHSIIGHHDDVKFIPPAGALAASESLHAHSDINIHCYHPYLFEDHWMLLHVKKYSILISDCCYENGYNYQKQVGELKEQVSLARNPTKIRWKNIEVSPVRNCIKMNCTDGDDCHCGANVAANLLKSLRKEKFVKPDKIQEVESFLETFQSSNGPLRRRYFLQKAFQWSADCFPEESQRLASLRSSQYLLEGIRDGSLTYYGKTLRTKTYMPHKERECQHRKKPKHSIHYIRNLLH